MIKEYKETELSIIVLDFEKKEETYLCLKSIRQHIKFPVKVIYYHNGNGSDYPYNFFKEGLCDVIIQTQKNDGLGIGTRDTFNFVFSEYTLSIQNDQIIGRDFTQEEFNEIKTILNPPNNIDGSKICFSIGLAGPVCGKNIYSERCHIIKTDYYKYMEKKIPLGYAGAGPYHQNGDWREAQIQNFYKNNNYFHFTEWPILVIDNGKRAIRQNPDGSIWEHFPDTKQLRLVRGPIKEKNIYPYFTDEEWDKVLKTQKWEEWRIPEKEIKNSFHVWH
jgi:hypothetical protein